ncbi:hypothetical protein ACI7RC_18820 [Brevibacillus sp. B_LB10_24]|uniref:hypothetical protein n=1 Tax=Brevibacillus sp. B_LB10_24 TaxID=3380645 RepID=UPI0038BAC693
MLHMLCLVHLIMGSMIAVAGFHQAIQTDVMLVRMTQSLEVTNPPKPTVFPDFPEKVLLRFHPVESSQWRQDLSTDRWEKKKTLRFGKIAGTPVTVDLYLEPSEGGNMPERIHGILRFQKQSIIFYELGFHLEDIETHMIGQTFAAKDGKRILLGGVGSTHTGFEYIMYDLSSRAWSSFHSFGVPLLTGGSGKDSAEIILQSPAVHLTWENVEILRWKSDRFELASVNDSMENSLRAKQADTVRLSSVYLADNRYLVITIQDGPETPAPSARYALRGDLLLKQ